MSKDQAELLKGIYPILILKLLNGNSPMYGYQIEKNVRILSDDQFSITQGSLYPILHKLEEKGLIKSFHKEVNNRTRKYYKITTKGRKNYDLRNTEVRSIFDSLLSFLNRESVAPDL
ncbi:MAG: helix-turn-helix transcriptional regulator [Bacteroidota bacterium]